jgi:vacuolar-type H+-ATPase subunit F/Vma7
VTQRQKIVVIGDEEAVFGLGLIGLEGHAVASLAEARNAVREAMASPDTALILLTENWSEARPETIDEFGAVVVEIPSQGAPKGLMGLQTRIERALGVQLERSGG